MIDFLKVFPERTAVNLAVESERKAVRKSLVDPFGGALDDESGDVLSKSVHHHFLNGDRVRVNSRGHGSHGHVGVITYDKNDNRLEVKLDSGHTIHCTEGDLQPEDFEAAPAADSAKIAKAAWGNPAPVTGESDVLAKRATTFKVGDRVIEKTTGRTGEVLSLSDSGMVELGFGPGNTMLCVASEVSPA